MYRKEFREVRRTLIKMARVGIEEVISLISNEKDPLVKLIATRRFKRRTDIPNRLRGISTEFSLLGRIYASQVKDPYYYRPKKTREIKLSRKQEAKVDLLLEKAILWVYKYWSSVTSARLLVRGGGFEAMESHIFEFSSVRSTAIPNRIEYRELLVHMFR
jgi:hypothetical protein